MTPANAAPAMGGHTHGHEHIHCISCGRHLDEHEFDDPPSATVVSCDHGSHFPSCVGCVPETKRRLAEHDRTGKPVQTAAAFH